MKRTLLFCGFLFVATAGVVHLSETTASGELLATVRVQDTTVVRRVYEGAGPDMWGTSPSPDGRYLTQTDWSTGDLAVLDLLTGQKRRVTDKKDDGWVSSGAYSEGARFSADGGRIAYSWYADSGTYELRVIDTDGTDSRLVARSGLDMEASNPLEWWPDLHGWSSDGENILATLYFGPAVVGDKGGEITLLAVADGSMKVLHKPDPGKAPMFAALSPDGRFLAFDENRVPKLGLGRYQSETDMDVFVKPLSDGSSVRVASGPSTDLLIGWTESGDLLFYSDRDLTEGVWRVPMRNGVPAGEAVRIAGDLWGMLPIGIVGDNLFYGVKTQVSRLHIVPLDLDRNKLAGPVTSVEREMRRSSAPAWSPEGVKLMYVVRAREPGGLTVPRLMLRSVAGGEVRDVTPDNIDFREFVQWSEDGRRVLVQARGPEGFFAYDLETGETELVDSPRRELSGVTVSRYVFSSDWSTVYLTTSNRADSTRAIVSRNVATQEQRTLLTRPGRSDAATTFFELALSPDGRWLAFLELDDPAMGTKLQLLSTAGGEPRTLLAVAWDPEDRLPRCRGSRNPLWTHDGRYILTTLRDAVPEGEPFLPNPCKLVKVPVDGGDPIFIGNIPQHERGWTLSPDDRRLVFGTGEARGEIWIMEGITGGN